MADPSQRPVGVVTGAGSGIGRAVAGRLASAGWRLVLAARTADALGSLAAELARDAGGPAADFLAAPTDVAEPAEVASLIDRAAGAFGRIDALVNNAGYAPLLPIGETDAATIGRALRVNALGPGCAVAAAWPHFERQGSGCVVNVSTLGTADPFPGFFAYAASKAAVNSMTRSIAKEGAPIGVRSFAIAPGAVETPMLRGLFDERALPREACLDPDDVASLIVACLTHERDEDNGRTLSIVRGPDGPVIERLPV